MNRKIAILAIIAILVTIGGFIFLTNKKLSTQESPPNLPPVQSTANQAVDYTASFAIYTEGVFRVFTASKYHNLSRDVFIQADNPNLVHIKKSGTTWDDFFKTLPMKLTGDCLTTGTKQTFCTDSTGTLNFYINGQEIDDLLQKQIKPNDKALITYGKENEEEIKIQLEKLNSLTSD